MNMVKPSAFKNKLFWRHVSSSAASYAAIPLAVFGVLQVYVGGCLGLLGASIVVLVILIAATILAIMKMLPKKSVEHFYRKPGTSIRVVVGDLFDRVGPIVVGFPDTFDVDTDDHQEGRIIEPRSVQGQLTERRYDGNWRQLEKDIEVALSKARAEGDVDEKKTFGRRVRYPIGTAVVIGEGIARCYCLVYARMNYDRKTNSSLDLIWEALSGLWYGVDCRDHGGELFMPVIGTEYARIGCLGRASMIKLIAISFLAYAEAKSPACKKLTIVVYPDDADPVNMLEIKEFLRSLD